MIEGGEQEAARTIEREGVSSLASSRSWGGTQIAGSALNSVTQAWMTNMVIRKFRKCIIGSFVVACAISLGWIDWQTGYELNFFVFYFLPVCIAAWYIGLGASVIIAVLCSIIWFSADILSGNRYSSPVIPVWNTMIRLSAFLAIGWAVSKINALLMLERGTSKALRVSLSEVKVLKGLLPICAQCKKIRDPHGQWQYLESYIHEHSDARFTHGYCPECARKAMAEARLLTDQIKQKENGGKT
ncbi:MAG: hypothetical protein NTZ78_14815 [Candidatus Aureabacteria bacterium]|nr:hypothetical protein [Candidatus Auribacterota bacterium]